MTHGRPSNEERLAQHLRTMSGELNAARRRVEELEERRREPIAVVGIGCRYPGGVSSADDLWKVVSEARDTVSGLPEDRGWEIAGPDPAHPDAPGRSCTTSGGFLHRAAWFDAEFFGISPREARAMDPQQRLLLETAWEAVENAGIAPDSLRDSRTGVFAGSNIQDYSHVLAAAPRAAEGHVVTGTTGAMVSGRLSYTLGLTGPSETIDTACSSSLVALHAAVRALREGECTAALAGGATVLTTPRAFGEFSRQRVLAPDGRCKAFGADADGFGLGEGAAMLFLERLSDARRLGHPVLAVVRGSAVNSDGASNGITAPNGPSQERVLRDALAAAEVSASEVDLVEAHGTGTKLGDPIEVRALMAVYGAARDPDAPLWVGSVKSNLGHTQAAAGAAGVIKAVLALQHRVLPPTLHADVPTPEVDWSAGTVLPLAEARAWRSAGRPRRAAVSAFGISGTNAHLIVEEAPPVPAPDTAAPDDPPLLPWLVSAHSAEALADQGDRLLSWCARRPDAAPGDVPRALLASRATLAHRAVALADGAGPPRSALRALAAGEPHPDLVRGRATEPGRLAFLLPGQGSQRPGMGGELCARFPVYAAAFDAACAEFDAHLPRRLREVVLARAGTAEAALLDRTEFAQPALFAVEVALFALLESWGVRPERLLGHSVGALAAAHVGGVLSLADACAVVAARGRLMQALPSGGTMAALQATEDEVVPLLRGREDRVGLAAVNGPRSVVVSGDGDVVDEVCAHWRESGRRVKQLNVSHAFHSPRMDGMLDDFLDVTASVDWHEPTIPLVSDMTGAPAGPRAWGDPRYWVDHVRRTVRFHDGLEALRADGVTAFLELGPDTALTGVASDSGRGTDVHVACLPRGRPEAHSVLTALARLHCHGVAVAWEALLPGRGRPLDLPTYPFQRERYWLEPEARPRAAEEDRFWSLVDAAPEALAAELGVAPDAELPAVLPALRRWRDGAARRTGTDAWRYGVAWRPVGSADEPSLTGRWLVVGDDAHGLVAALSGLGAEVTHLPATASSDRAALAALLAPLPPPDGVVATPGADEPSSAVLALLQALGDAGFPAPLWCLTRGAVAVAQEAPDVAQAAVWGLGRVAALEHPDRWGGLLDLPAALPTDLGPLLGSALTGPDDQLALREGGLLARRLVPRPAAGGAAPELSGTALVTGGTGGLGARVAKSLAARGARHLLLLSRRGPDAPGAGPLRDELAALGATATIRACDVADRAALARALADVPEEQPLRAVVHAAGVLDDGVLDAQTPERLATVLAAKSVAARHLHELTHGQDLAAFVVFSSLAGVLGTPGQGNYAAANAQLDALAEQRHAQGRPATSVAWGPWAEDGMAHGLDTGRLRKSGVRPMDPDLALDALWDAVGDGAPTVLVADVEWDAFAARAAAFRPSTQLAELTAAAAGPRARTPTLDRDLPGLPPAERHARVRGVVREHVAVTLGHGSGWRLDSELSFRSLGFDSLMAVELRNRLDAATGLKLPSTLVFDHPTPEALVAHLLSALLDEATTGPEAALAEVDRLEGVLGSASLDDEARGAVEARLRELLKHWSAGPADGPALAQASAEEVVDFINDELGIALDPGRSRPTP
ncbi:type I polyketide synthase [Streptomyces sulphureus]|uniref:type I polyketide synthase n=1 Tax=Streptomyces sulphureus TaxID=47758 RepID=UPI0003716BF2